MPFHFSIIEFIFYSYLFLIFYHGILEGFFLSQKLGPSLFVMLYFVLHFFIILHYNFESFQYFIDYYIDIDILESLLFNLEDFINYDVNKYKLDLIFFSILFLILLFFFFGFLLGYLLELLLFIENKKILNLKLKKKNLKNNINKNKFKK